jgi:hypothetical protein
MTGRPYGRRLPWMPTPRISPDWLSDDMAHALAAMSPPLRTSDVVQAANALTVHSPPTHVMRHLLDRGADLKKVRMVVEALGALRDLRIARASGG